MLFQVSNAKQKTTKKQKRILLRLDSFQVFTNHLFDNVNSDNFMDFPLNFNQLLMCACTAIWRKIILKLAQLEFYLNSNLKRLALCDSSRIYLQPISNDLFQNLHELYSIEK